MYLYMGGYITENYSEILYTTPASELNNPTLKLSTNRHIDISTYMGV